MNQQRRVQFAHSLPIHSHICHLVYSSTSSLVMTENATIYCHFFSGVGVSGGGEGRGKERDHYLINILSLTKLYLDS